jgi:hypothetical protein
LFLLFSIESATRWITSEAECVEVGFSGTCFSLWGFAVATTKIHRLKPLPLKPWISIEPLLHLENKKFTQSFPAFEENPDE